MAKQNDGGQEPAPVNGGSCTKLAADPTTKVDADTAQPTSKDLHGNDQPPAKHLEFVEAEAFALLNSKGCKGKVMKRPAAAPSQAVQPPKKAQKSQALPNSKANPTRVKKILGCIRCRANPNGCDCCTSQEELSSQEMNGRDGSRGGRCENIHGLAAGGRLPPRSPLGFGKTQRTHVKPQGCLGKNCACVCAAEVCWDSFSCYFYTHCFLIFKAMLALILISLFFS